MGSRSGPPRKDPPRVRDEARGAGGLSHLDSQGAARMVDVGGKEATRRVAVASGQVRMLPSTQALIRSGAAPKAPGPSCGRDPKADALPECAGSGC